jgi:hypothetical protein
VTYTRNVFCRFFRVAKRENWDWRKYFSKKGKTQRSGELNRAMLRRTLVGLFSAAAQLSVLAEGEPTRSEAR